MLLHLKISDFAIIDHVRLDFERGFTVITGETGAGKSIVVDALLVVLGGRASAEMIREGAEQAEVEALFDVREQPLLKARLEARDLVGDDPDVLILRRSFSRKGKARVSINGHLASVATLAEVVRGLVDISGQHAQQTLLHVENHLEILDAYAELGEERRAYTQAYERWQALRGRATTLLRDQGERLRQADFLKFQIDELERLDPKPGEEQELEQELRRLSHAERLAADVSQAEQAVYSGEDAALDRVGRAAALLEGLVRVDGALAPLGERLRGVAREIEDVAHSLQQYAGRCEADPERSRAVDARLGELRHVLRKHGGATVDLGARLDALRVEYAALQEADGQAATIEQEVAVALDVARHAAERLHERRVRAAAALGEAVVAELAEMELAGATFVVNVAGRAGSDGPDVLGPTGHDAVEFLWSANRGESPRALVRIASGGELSRLMLAVKGVLRSRDLVSLYIFDEVDTGLSGKAADSIGRKIQRVAAEHQAVVISHLAPIAARADHHLYVEKVCEGGRTTSRATYLKGAERAAELARMIDGGQVSQAARRAAKEMMTRARTEARAHV